MVTKAWEIIPIDVMLGDRFQVTIKYRHCLAFKLNFEDICTKIFERRPSLQDKNFCFYIGEQKYEVSNVKPPEKHKQPTRGIPPGFHSFPKKSLSGVR